MSNELTISKNYQTMQSLLPEELKEQANKILDAMTFEKFKSLYVHGQPQDIARITKDQMEKILIRCRYSTLNLNNDDMWILMLPKDNEPRVYINYMVNVSRAYLQPTYDGYKSGFVYSNNILTGAWCEVYRSDMKHPIRFEARLADFTTNMSTWKSKPGFMIEKVAINNAFKRAYRDININAPVREEMTRDESNVISASYEVKDEKEIEKKPASLQLRKKMFATFNNHKVKSDMLKEYLKSTNQIEKSSTELTESNVVDLIDNAESISQAIKEIENEPNEKPLSEKEEPQQDLGV